MELHLLEDVIDSGLLFSALGMNQGNSHYIICFY